MYPQRHTCMKHECTRLDIQPSVQNFTTSWSDLFQHFFGPPLKQRFQGLVYKQLLDKFNCYLMNGTMVTCDPIIRSLVTLFCPITCDPIIRSPATLSLYLRSPPCVPPSHGLHFTSLFKFPPPCVPLNHGLHSTFLFKFPPPCVPLNHCLHSTS